MASRLQALLFSATLFAQGPSQEGPSALSNTYYKAETYRLTGRVVLAMEAYKNWSKRRICGGCALPAGLHFEQGLFILPFNMPAMGGTVCREHLMPG